MKRLLLLGACIGALNACDSDVSAPEDPPTITVMTRNIYVGADIDPLLAAASIDEIPQLVAQTWQSVVATNFPERAEALADEIAAAQPDLIGLQEVSLFRTQSPGDFLAGNPQAAGEVVLDQLALLLDALKARGLSYSAVAVSRGFDVELPMVTAAGLDDMRLTDHEVILARSGIQITNVREENFNINLEVPVGGPSGLTVTVLRGWVSVDATIDGTTWRFVSTHLEPPEFAPAVQIAQAQELTAALEGATDKPIILVGDLNSAADGSSTPTHADLLATGFADAWRVASGSDAGFTCCMDPDLRNSASNLSKRIDYILVRGEGIEVQGARVVGADPSGRTESGLWLSDHAGIVARLTINETA